MTTKNQQMEKMNYKNDPLLEDSCLFIDGKFNLYGALFRKTEMLKNNKGQVYKKAAYIRDDNGEISTLIRQLNNGKFSELRQTLANYIGTKRVRLDTVTRGLEKGVFPLPLVRVTCHLKGRDVLEVLNGKTITDFCNKSSIKFPALMDDICSDFMAYFIGLHLGDGTVNEERWKMVDGDESIEGLKFSALFLAKVKLKLEQIFSIKSARLSKVKDKNAYELRVPNKWFCRYLNFTYSLEFGEKKNPKLPLILKHKQNLIVRGLFDTDGSVKNVRIGIGTKYRDLKEEIGDVLSQNDIDFKEKLSTVHRKNELYHLEIMKEDLHKFILCIGFSHPRKILEARKCLLSSSCKREFVVFSKEYRPLISEKDFLEMCQYLRPIKNAGKIRLVAAFDRLDEVSKERVIKNVKANFNLDKSVNKHRHINSYKAERILTRYCQYRNIRVRMNESEIDKALENISQIWEC
jgi:hypothetical protein